MQWLLRNYAGGVDVSNGVLTEDVPCDELVKARTAMLWAAGTFLRIVEHPPSLIVQNAVSPTTLVLIPSPVFVSHIPNDSCQQRPRSRTLPRDDADE